MFNNDFEKLNNYIEEHSEPESELLKELHRQTYLKMLRPRMLSGHIQGRVLSMISKMISPKNILEIGTFTGYSAICMAEGLTADGKLYTYDINDEIESFTRGFLNQSTDANKIVYQILDARKTLEQSNTIFDLVFIDGDKRQYPEYFTMVLPRVKPGGYIIADNVLWNEKVIEPNAEKDSYTKGVMDFNRMVNESVQVENVIFPFRDGLMVMRKKQTT